MSAPTFHRPWLDGIKVVDPLVADLIEREAARQDEHIELVASENYTWARSTDGACRARREQAAPTAIPDGATRVAAR